MLWSDFILGSKAPIMTAADDNFVTPFLIFEKKQTTRNDISWESSASKDSHEIYLNCYFWESYKIWNCRLLQIIGGILWVNSLLAG